VEAFWQLSGNVKGVGAFMAALPVLGGFKILKDVVRISIISSPEDKGFPVRLFSAINREKINLPYLTSVYFDNTWGLNVIVEGSHEERTLRLIQSTFGKGFQASPARSAVLSLFPHKNNPAVAGTLVETLASHGVAWEALASSPSAVSVVLEERLVERASDALFGPFDFSAYRTPSDWKLAQKGKEMLYKEVVASYQEKRPKVYGLNYRDSQNLFIVEVDRKGIASFGRALKSAASRGFNLSFLASSPDNHGKVNIFFCLPKPGNGVYQDSMRELARDKRIANVCSAAMFSMTGPHFGDRYGIASELLNTLNKAGIELTALTCTIASVRGVVDPHQIQSAIKAIKSCFEVPAVIKRD
jgi:aspartokinase